ncbi:MAG: hypothetical protein ACI379_06995 [Nocardioides sp.]|uniref:hypothetical protein n=1 Tax=Nocardioides sp. TaxID=35761 RepID=UPI003F113043
MDNVIVYVAVAAVVLAVFVGLWWLDARRSQRQAHDPERLDVDTTDPHPAPAHRLGSDVHPTRPTDQE